MNPTPHFDIINATTGKLHIQLYVNTNVVCSVNRAVLFVSGVINELNIFAYFFLNYIFFMWLFFNLVVLDFVLTPDV